MGYGSSYVTETTETEAPLISLLRGGSIRVVPVLQTASTPAPTVTTPAVATVATLQATTPGATEASSPSTTQTTTTPTTETPTASTASPAEGSDICRSHDVRSAVFHLRLYLNLTVGKSKPLQYFWDRSIYHVGVLDTATVNPREADIIPALECLKILRTLSQEIMAQGIKVFTFLAASIPDAAWASFYIRNFKNLFMPDLYIAIGHYSLGDNSLPSCRVVAPTLLQRPLGAEDSYQHDLTTAVESFVRLSSQPLKFAVSVTMKGRVTIPTDPKNRGFLAPCKTDDTLLSFSSHTEACNSPDYVSPPLYNSTVDASQYRHVSEPTLLSYDDSRGLANKLCTIKAQHTTAKFGIAVFDIDYADFANTCRSRGGPFSRLHLIRSVLNFFRTRYRTTADMKDCMDLASGPSTAG
ncbi:hypothetical protein HPB50_024780 [Hyalomma asiaticum]|uniref:Uncharacterized protein n=1 Tax=Hyalomma asiaticum TaxID=266040 RepID=A0ACB7TBT6_HYAAI|nr:hypothetical protein HPB50_024780 [Hyalomma asiaticum]